MLRVALIVLTALTLFFSQRVRAEPIAPNLAVSYADLDLRTATGAKVMLSRIRRAAARVCTQVSSNVGADFEAGIGYEACRRGAITRAVRRLDAPIVSALFVGASPQLTASADR